MNMSSPIYEHFEERSAKLGPGQTTPSDFSEDDDAFWAIWPSLAAPQEDVDDYFAASLHRQLLQVPPLSVHGTGFAAGCGSNGAANGVDAGLPLPDVNISNLEMASHRVMEELKSSADGEDAKRSLDSLLHADVIVGVERVVELSSRKANFHPCAGFVGTVNTLARGRTWVLINFRCR
ncbi:hypothetical protein DOTSEDRAFT_37514 [Dothistroma septosporum NZE10]|uniref:Uncharacterized protein n=1 Tax=Dothistroma septosporum (strain NZE10 / CBS 128990) TaxID=675120 RepID=N1PGV3_DOTSN|nr:hypothetical protein DOTSEDRAFT_37514 [Dothistroma septosporum NZE10]